VLEIAPVTPERFGDMCELFERRGPRGGRRNAPAYGCWCMYWRDRSLPHGQPKKRAMAALVRAGRTPGLLAYDDGMPVGWVSLGPREDFPYILRSPQYRPREKGGGAAVWSLVCFAVDRYTRRRGVAAALLQAAIEHAFARGATSLEVYPHRDDPRDYMGHVELFDRAGFAHVREANRRAIMRLERAAPVDGESRGA
jgi:ribosomal protein S18 acetylase RimI-like enzyme